MCRSCPPPLLPPSSAAEKRFSYNSLPLGLAGLVVGKNGALTNSGRRYGDRPGDDSAGGPPHLHYIICQSCVHLTCARPQPILRDCRLAFRRACNSPYGRECGRRYRGPTQELIPPTVDRHESAFSSARSHPASIQTRIPLAHFAVSRLTRAFVNWALRLGLDEMWSGILRRRWSLARC